MKISVLVRKRPLFKKEALSGQIDCVSMANPVTRVGEPKFKIDGITKYIENHDFVFDNSYHDNEDTDSVYESSIQPLLNNLFNNGVVTVFAYGQTGSGKTHTMVGIQKSSIHDIFTLSQSQYADLNPE